MKGKRALALDVRYVRDGEHEGNMFVSRGPAASELELTTPSYIIRMNSDQARELWAEIHRLFGWDLDARLRADPGAA